MISPFLFMETRSKNKVELSTEANDKMVQKLVAENEKLEALAQELQASVHVLEDQMNQRKDMELQLADSQKMEALGQLAAGIAHEINNPAQFIGDHLYFIKETIEEILDGHPTEGLNSEFVRENLPIAIDSSISGVARIGEIVASMRRFSHRDRDQEKHPADLNQAVLDSISVSRNQWKNHALVETELDPDLPLVPCLLGEMNQVILNLIVNATHAIMDHQKDRKGKIIVRTKQVGEDSILLEIEDDGGGIPEDVHDRIFEPFFTTKELGKGTGQGLALAHSVIVNKHEGKLAFDTEQGVGTTFSICLPLSIEEKKQAAEIPYCKGWPKNSS